MDHSRSSSFSSACKPTTKGSLLSLLERGYSSTLPQSVSTSTATMTTTKDLPRLVIGAISTALDVIATDLEYLDDDDEDDDVSHEDDDDNLLVGNQSSIFRDTRRRQ